jgi:sugar-specific transcriptional regulator TrmB
MSDPFDEHRLEEMTRFGFTSLQAKVYVALHSLGEVSVKQIQEFCRVHKAEVYRVLTDLEEMEAVDRIVAHPARFRARHPGEVLKSLLLPTIRRMETLGESKADLLEWFESLRPSSHGPRGSGFEIIRDRHALKRAVEMLDRSKESVFYVAKLYEDKIRGGVVDAFNRAVNRGVKARGLLCITDQDVGILKRLKWSPRVSRRHSDCAYSWTLIVDGREALFGSAPAVIPGEEFLYTRNRRYISHLIRTFEIHYEQAVPIDDRIKEIWGPAMAVGGRSQRPN